MALYHRYQVIAIANNMMFMDFTETSNNGYIDGAFIDKFYYSMMNRDLNDIVIFKTASEIFVMPRYAVSVTNLTQTVANASYNTIVSRNATDSIAAQKFLDESARIDKRIYYEQWFRTWERIDYLDVQLDTLTKFVTKFVSEFPEIKNTLESENSNLCSLLSQCCANSNDIDTSVPLSVQQNLISGNKMSHRSWQRGYYDMWNTSESRSNLAETIQEKHPWDTYTLDVDKFYSEDSLL